MVSRASFGFLHESTGVTNVTIWAHTVADVVANIDIKVNKLAWLCFSAMAAACAASVTLALLEFHWAIVVASAVVAIALAALGIWQVRKAKVPEKIIEQPTLVSPSSDYLLSIKNVLARCPWDTMIARNYKELSVRIADEGRRVYGDRAPIVRIKSDKHHNPSAGGVKDVVYPHGTRLIIESDAIDDDLLANIIERFISKTNVIALELRCSGITGRFLDRFKGNRSLTWLKFLGCNKLKDEYIDRFLSSSQVADIDMRSSACLGEPLRKRLRENYRCVDVDGTDNVATLSKALMEDIVSSIDSRNDVEAFRENLKRIAGKHRAILTSSL